MKVQIRSDKMPAALGPYSAGIVTEQFIFLSGQVGTTLDGNLISDDVVEQTKQAFNNIEILLNEAGSDFDHVVKTTVFLSSMEDFGKVNEEYGKHFSGVYPARSCFEVSKLPKDAKVEIECIVVK